MALPAVLRSLGADPAKVLPEVGVDLDLFDDPGNLISFEARGRLLAHCAARTACPHFGLLVGQQAGLHSFGFVGLLARCSPDAGTALRSLSRYLHLHVRGAVTTLSEQADLAMLSYEIYQPLAEGSGQLADGAIAASCNIMRELCGPEWLPIEVQFAHRRPEDVGPFRHAFGVPLRFDAEQNAVVFSAAWLTRRLPEADPELRRLLQEQIDKLEVRHGRNFPEQVRGVLRHSIVMGQSTADEVAAVFSMHRRTLNRHLNTFGTSFQDLVDEIRFEVARQMLEESAMEIAQLAVLLDYASTSAFTRAFRRWSGTTPAQWRASMRDTV